MYSETQKFSRAVYTLVILWCCVIKVYGGSDSNVEPLVVTKTDSMSDLLKILSGNQNEGKNNSLNSVPYMNVNIKSININIPLISPDSNTTATKHKSSIKNVRDDYTLTEGIGYHKYHRWSLDWNNARKACEAENAHLAVINSAKEAEILTQLVIDKGNSEQTYLGAHDLFAEGDWVTVTGESMAKIGYSGWDSGEPSDSGRTEDCAVLCSNGRMNDVPCDFAYSYICEIPL